MLKPVQCVLVAVLALLAGCPLESDDGVALHAYLGTWKLADCGGGLGGVRECADDDPDTIVLSWRRYEEYRQGALYLSAEATYVAGCFGEDQLTLQVDGRFLDWCLTLGDGDLYACESVPDGYCWHFRR